MWAPGSFPAPTHGCPLFLPYMPLSSWGGCSASAVQWPPPPQPMPYARVTGASRRAGSVPCCLIASCTWLRLAQGTGGGGAARMVSPAELSPEINPPASARGGRAEERYR